MVWKNDDDDDDVVLGYVRLELHCVSSSLLSSFLRRKFKILRTILLLIMFSITVLSFFVHFLCFNFDSSWKWKICFDRLLHVSMWRAFSCIIIDKQIRREKRQSNGLMNLILISFSTNTIFLRFHLIHWQRYQCAAINIRFLFNFFCFIFIFHSFIEIS